MDVKSSVMLSGEMGLRRKLETIANNIANMDTTGFKREDPVFRTFLENMDDAPVPASGAKRTAYVLDYGTTHDTAAGAFKATGNPLDFMINGEGYFAIRMGDGSTAYTRNGHFEVNSNGVVVDGSGRELLSADGQPIQLDPTQRGKISVTANGSILGPEGLVGQVGITRFGNEGFVEQRGDGLFNGQGGTPAAADTIVLKVGGLEGSNVNGVVETASLIEVQRRYQTSRAMSDSMNDLRKSAIQRLGRVD